jgi:hypothetical protein
MPKPSASTPEETQGHARLSPIEPAKAKALSSEAEAGTLPSGPAEAEVPPTAAAEAETAPPSKAVEADAPPNKLSSFLKMANDYKELAGLFVFTIGGILSAFAFFATKQQLLETRCILNANIAFIQDRMDAGSLSQLMLENLKESATLEKANLTPDEILKRNQLKVGATDIARKLADADNAAAKELNKLKSGDCTAN